MRFWLEWDRGTESTRDLNIKCQTYAHYVVSQEFVKGKNALPLLLIVTPERGQELRITRVADSVLDDTHGFVVLTTTVTRLNEQGLLAQIWYQILPKQKVTDEMPRCRFYDVAIYP